MSGADHGVELSRGQLMETFDGAGAVPSVTARMETSGAAVILIVRAASPVNWPSHRSEPAGLGTELSVPRCTCETSVPVVES